MKKLLTLMLSAAIALSAAGCMPKSLSEVAGNVDDSSLNAVNSGVGYAEDGYAEGYLGDTMHTCFFDFTVNSAYTCGEFDGFTAEDGYKFLVAEVEIENTTSTVQPMGILDFQIQWEVQEGEDPDEAYDYPVCEAVEDENGTAEYVALSQRQFPVEWELDVDASRTGLLVYAVPEVSEEYSIAYLEIFAAEDDEESESGDVFFVYFSAETQ